MNRALIRQVMESQTIEAIQAFFADKETVFWVNSVCYEHEIVRNCARFLKGSSLTLESPYSEYLAAGGECTEVENDEEYEEDPDVVYEMYICYGDRRLLVSVESRYYLSHFCSSHFWLCMLNKALWPDYEIRCCIDSMRSEIQSAFPKTSWTFSPSEPDGKKMIESRDTLGFLVLPTSDWRLLEGQYGEDVQKRFYKLTPEVDLFEDVLSLSCGCTFEDGLCVPYRPAPHARWSRDSEGTIGFERTAPDMFAFTPHLERKKRSGTTTFSPQAQNNRTKRKAHRPWNHA